jgi:hypothetical protein
MAEPGGSAPSRRGASFPLLRGVGAVKLERYGPAVLDLVQGALPGVTPASAP